MRRYLLVLLAFTFFLSSRVRGQADQVVNNGDNTTAINFPGGGCVYNWTNNHPEIGLAASGTGNINSFNVINQGNTPIVATISGAPVTSGLAYIGNGGSNTVLVIDVATNTIKSTITIADYPIGVAASKDGTRVYTANQSGTVSVINTSNNAVVATITITLFR